MTEENISCSFSNHEISIDIQGGLGAHEPLPTSSHHLPGGSGEGAAWSLLTAPMAGCWQAQSSADLGAIILYCVIENNCDVTCKDRALSISLHSSFFNVLSAPSSGCFLGLGVGDVKIPLMPEQSLIRRPLISNESLNLLPSTAER